MEQATGAGVKKKGRIRWANLAIVSLFALPILISIPILLSPAFRQLRAEKAQMNAEVIDAIELGDIARLKRLIQAGASVNAKTRSGITALSLATIRGETGIAGYLIERGATLDARDKSGDQMSPGNGVIHWAAIYGRIEILEMLLERGFVPDTRDKNGTTLLMLAAENGHEGMVRLLLKRGANPHTHNLLGETPVSCARKSGKQSVIELILQAGGK
jgi:ankyrin repeat protein